MEKSEIEILREENAELKEDLCALVEEYDDTLEDLRAICTYISQMPNVIPSEEDSKQQESVDAKVKEIREARYDSAKRAGYRGSFEEFCETLK